jgi:hypothetical protein
MEKMAAFDGELLQQATPDAETLNQSESIFKKSNYWISSFVLS